MTAIHWNFDAVLFSLGPLTVRWYGLLFVGAFFVGQWMLARIFKREGIAPEAADKLLLWALFGTIAGARLVHCLFYDPGFYLAHPLEILKVWEGGLASHGGAIGMLLGLWWGRRAAGLTGHSFLWLLDRVALPAALGGAFVRVANFLNAEIVGRPTDGSWGVIFDAVDQLPRHPVQLYEAGAYVAIFALLVALYRRRSIQPGFLVGCYMLLVFAARIAAEFFKTPQAVYEAGQLFTVGQWLSVPFVLLGAALILRARKSAR